MTDPDQKNQLRQIVANSLAAGDPSGWFEHLYAAAAQGEAFVPWDRRAAHPRLVEWVEQHKLDGHGRKAMVVGSGFGDNAEYLAARGFETTGFDISSSAIDAARRRFPDTKVTYLVADLLHPPAEWRLGFDLVVEIYTVQALPEAYRQETTRIVAQMVAPGGTLLVIAAAREADERPDGPPWPLTRAEIDDFATDGLQPVRIDELPVSGHATPLVWRGEFRRPGA